MRFPPVVGTWRRIPDFCVRSSCHTLGVPSPRMSGGPRKYTDDRLAIAVAESRNMREVLIALGLAPRGGNYETVWRRIEAIALDASHLRPRVQRGRSVRSCSDDEITDAVRISRSLAQVLASLEIRRGGNQARLKRRIERLGLDTSHFLGQGWRRGTNWAPVPAAPLDELLIVGRTVHSSNLRRRLIHEGLKQESARCGVWPAGTGILSHSNSTISTECEMTIA